jgi:Domain of unknown function (DUF5753)
MPQARVLDPGSSLLAFFGAELRRRRTAAGLSQDQLGHAITYSAALAIPGLLQTADYARALFRAGRPADSDEQIESRVTARLERQRILDRAKPPMFWVVVDEGVLRRPVGGAAMFREQLAYLITIARHRGVMMQVMPFSSGAHAGLLGEFTLLGMADGRDIGYTESVESARLIEQADEVAAFSVAFDMVGAVALSPDASLDFVARLEGDISHGLDHG